jgi:hypothetical protein
VQFLNFSLEKHQQRKMQHTTVMSALLQETTFIQGTVRVSIIAVYYVNYICKKEAFVAGETVTLAMVNMARFER